MANPHPQPHPENLRPIKKGDPSAKEIQRKGAKASHAAQIKKRTMREWAQFFAELPVHDGKITDPETADTIRDANLTMEGAVIAAMYGKAIKGDTKAATFLANMRGQLEENIKVSIDAVAGMNTEELIKLYEKTRPKNAED